MSARRITRKQRKKEAVCARRFGQVDFCCYLEAWPWHKMGRIYFRRLTSATTLPGFSALRYTTASTMSISATTSRRCCSTANEAGSGYTDIYVLRLPKDPPVLPKQDGTGGTGNFQLHPAFWVGMAMCDDQSQSYPADLHAPNCAVRRHRRQHLRQPGPGIRQLHRQAPGHRVHGDAVLPARLVRRQQLTQWTAALNIDSLSQNLNTGQGNNSACGGAIEYVNFAFIQTDGVPFPPGSPSPLGPLVATNFKTLFMDPGDELVVTLKDTEHGLKITVDDLTSGQSGFMVASAANGFAEILFDPSGNNCDFATHNLPYDFHPMYATSSTHTRVPWAAHSYGIAFSDEIGHFEYCRAVAKEGGACISSGIKDPPGLDETFCFDAAFAASFGFIPIGGCIDADIEFDGVPVPDELAGHI